MLFRSIGWGSNFSVNLKIEHITTPDNELTLAASGSIVYQKQLNSTTRRIVYKTDPTNPHPNNLSVQIYDSKAGESMGIRNLMVCHTLAEVESTLIINDSNTTAVTRAADECFVDYQLPPNTYRDLKGFKL